MKGADGLAAISGKTETKFPAKCKNFCRQINFSQILADHPYHLHLTELTFESCTMYKLQCTMYNAISLWSALKQSARSSKTLQRVVNVISANVQHCICYIAVRHKCTDVNVGQTDRVSNLVHFRTLLSGVAHMSNTRHDDDSDEGGVWGIGLMFITMIFDPQKVCLLIPFYWNNSNN